jgi:hypothetical protein
MSCLRDLAGTDKHPSVERHHDAFALSEANAAATGRRLTPMTRDLKVLRRNNP